MKLLFKQRRFSWFDSYDIYNEQGETVYIVKGQFSLGHCLKIFDLNGKEIGLLEERLLSWLPKFDMYIYNNYIGCIKKEFSFFKPRFNIDYNGWQINGDFLEWDYSIKDSSHSEIATVSKEILNWTDTYVIDVHNPDDAIYALMLVLAIDAEKCSRNN